MLAAALAAIATKYLSSGTAILSLANTTVYLWLKRREPELIRSFQYSISNIEPDFVYTDSYVIFYHLYS